MIQDGLIVSKSAMMGFAPTVGRGDLRRFVVMQVGRSGLIFGI